MLPYESEFELIIDEMFEGLFVCLSLVPACELTERLMCAWMWSRHVVSDARFRAQ